LKGKENMDKITQEKQQHYDCAEDAIQARLRSDLRSYAQEILKLVIETVQYPVYATHANKLPILTSIQDEQTLRELLIKYPFINDMFFYTMLAEGAAKKKILLAKISQFMPLSPQISTLLSSPDFKLSDQGKWEIQYFSNPQSSFLTQCKNNIRNIDNYINTTIVIESLEFLALFWYVFTVAERDELLKKIDCIHNTVCRDIEKIDINIKKIDINVEDFEIEESRSSDKNRYLSLKKELDRDLLLKEKLEKIIEISSSVEKTFCLQEKVSADIRLLTSKICKKEMLTSSELDEGLCLIKFWLKLVPACKRDVEFSICRDALSDYIKTLEEDCKKNDIDSIKIFLNKCEMLPLNFENEWMWQQIAACSILANVEVPYSKILSRCTELNSSFSEYIFQVEKEIYAIQKNNASCWDCSDYTAYIKMMAKNSEDAKSKLYYCCHKLTKMMNKSSLFGIPPFSLQGKIDRNGKILDKDDVEYCLYDFAANTYLYFTENKNGEECYQGRQYIEGAFNKNHIFRLIADYLNKLKQRMIPRKDKKKNEQPYILMSGDETQQNSEDDKRSLFDTILSKNTFFDYQTEYGRQFLKLVKEYDLGFFLFLVLYRNIDTQEDLRALVADFKKVPVSAITSAIFDNEKWNMHELYTFLYDLEKFDTRYMANNFLSLAVFIRVEKGIKDYDDYLRKICNDYWNTARGKAKSRAEKCALKTILNCGGNI